MPKLTLDLEEIEGSGGSLEDSFAIQNGQFLRGQVEISADGVAVAHKEKVYTGLSGEDMEVLKTIGRGTSSHVNLVRHRSGRLMALKVINMYERSKRQQIMEEIQTLYGADCPCLVGFYGAFFYEGSISIALEFMDQGCLETVLQTYGRIPERVLAAVTFQCLWGLGYLRHEKRVHRDIKPQNILCNSNGEVKLTDFGISKELENSIGLCQTFVGTFKYMSPERIQSHPYSYGSDIWSLGLVILECFAGKYPYPECRTYIEMVQTILESPPPLPVNEATPEFVDFVKCCLRKDPRERVPVTILLEAPWLQMHGAVTVPACQNIVRSWFDSFHQQHQQYNLQPHPPSAPSQQQIQFQQQQQQTFDVSRTMDMVP